MQKKPRQGYIEQKTGTTIPDTGKTTKPRANRVKTVTGFLAGFVSDSLNGKIRYGNYSISKSASIDKLIYTSWKNEYDWDQKMNTHVITGEEIIAVKLKGGVVLSNASRLKLCGSHVVYGGSRSYNSVQTPAQKILEKAGAIPIPFSVFADANLSLVDARVIEKAPAETITIEVGAFKNNEHVRLNEKRHYVGACLLEIKGNYFLFDIDREELKHKIFNPFIVKLHHAAKTVAEAYLTLKPAKVVMAEIEGRIIERQGEWFFVKRYDELPALPKPSQELLALANNPPDARTRGATRTDSYYRPGYSYGFSFDNKKRKKTYEAAVKAWEEANKKVHSGIPREGELRQGKGRPNKVEKFVSHDSTVLVSGKITHAGREHRDLHLDGWWEAIPNTAVESWQVTGEID